MFTRRERLNVGLHESNRLNSYNRLYRVHGVSHTWRAAYFCVDSTNFDPGIERVQALADISRSALCCHNNETSAPIANPPNYAQLEDTPYHSPKLHPGPCSSVGIRRGTDTHLAVNTIHFASATPHAKCNKQGSHLEQTCRRATWRVMLNNSSVASVHICTVM